MKYTGIELLQAIKEEKFEKGTKFLCVDWRPTTANNNVYFNSEGILKWEVSNNSLTQEVLIKYHFEVIEEKPKKIEELELVSLEIFKTMTPAERYHVTAKEYDKINDLTEAVNYLLEKESDK